MDERGSLHVRGRKRSALGRNDGVFTTPKLTESSRNVTSKLDDLFRG